LLSVNADGLLHISKKNWMAAFYFLTTIKFLAILGLIMVGAGGISAWCDCENRPWKTPFQEHLHGFGGWYQALVWVHVIIAVVISIPMFAGMFSPKGSLLHVYSGRTFVGFWAFNMVVGIICGVTGMAARGPFPGQDASNKATNHYWGTFPLYVYFLNSFVLSSACDQLLNGLAALQYRHASPPNFVMRGIVFGSTLTLLNGWFMLVTATFVLANFPPPNTSMSVFPWFFYIMVPIEMFMALKNVIYWNDKIDRQKNWVYQHIRCMGWVACLTFYFIVENVIYRVITIYYPTSYVAYWWMLPGHIGNIILFSAYIVWNQQNAAAHPAVLVID